MGSRRFLYFLPDPGSSLSADRFARALLEPGVVINPVTCINELDEDGDLRSAREHRLSMPYLANLTTLVGTIPMNGSVDSTFHGTDLLFVASFGSPHNPPLFSVSFSRRWWFGQPPGRRESLMHTFIEAATCCGAVSILIVDDPPDTFFGMLALIDEQWVLDPHHRDGTEISTSGLFIKQGCSNPVILGNTLRSTGCSVRGFCEFQITSLPSAGPS